MNKLAGAVALVTGGNGGVRLATAKRFLEMEHFKDRYRTMIDAIPAMAWSSLPDGSVEFLNRRWLDFTGLTLDEALGWGWTAAVHPDDLISMTDGWRALLASVKVGEIEARLRRQDGEYRWFLFRAEPVRDDHGNIISWYGANTDIEDRKRAESLLATAAEQIKKSEAELRTVIDAIPQLITAIGADGKFQYANQAVLDYTGLTKEQVMSDRFAEIFHREDTERLGGKRRASISRGVPFEYERRMRRKDGEYRWLLIQYNPLRNEAGNIIRWYATATDIEERKQAEERTRKENFALREEIDHSSMFEEIVGSSAAIRATLSQVAKVAKTDSTVLILGETGTGKELIARAVHRRSRRAKGAFVAVNCAAISPSLITSELFGHEKGAFTGALQRRVGRFESADRGTIFLDEIGELPIDAQIALLRVLQEREFEPIGSNHPVRVDVRVVAATNRDLGRAVEAGTFRQDLFYRLNVFPIRIPPLRERVDDIPLLVKYLIDRYGKKAAKKFMAISRQTLELFESYDWPGNVRELQNVIERAVVLCDDETFSVDETWLKRTSPRPAGSEAPLMVTVVAHERELIEAALAKSKGRIAGPSGAAAKLGIPRQTLESKIRSLGIEKNRVGAA